MIELLIIPILMMVNYAANKISKAVKQIDEILSGGELHE